MNQRTSNVSIVMWLSAFSNHIRLFSADTNYEAVTIHTQGFRIRRLCVYVCMKAYASHLRKQRASAYGKHQTRREAMHLVRNSCVVNNITHV
uniref:Uncharacterized protein n=1 Tax=Octopus bimaculoides TaxID=37653 RepID=A0A0L8GRZ3_OCTBM